MILEIAVPDMITQAESTACHPIHVSIPVHIMVQQINVLRINLFPVPHDHLHPALPPLVAMVTVTRLFWCNIGNRVCSVCSNFRSLLSPLLAAVSGILASPPTQPPPLTGGAGNGGSLHLERSWMSVHLSVL